MLASPTDYKTSNQHFTSLYATKKIQPPPDLFNLSYHTHMLDSKQSSLIGRQRSETTFSLALYQTEPSNKIMTSHFFETLIFCHDLKQLCNI